MCDDFKKGFYFRLKNIFLLTKFFVRDLAACYLKYSEKLMFISECLVVDVVDMKHNNPLPFWFIFRSSAL